MMMDIFAAIEVLYDVIRPRKLLFIAIDGVVRFARRLVIGLM